MLADDNSDCNPDSEAFPFSNKLCLTVIVTRMSVHGQEHIQLWHGVKQSGTVFVRYEENRVFEEGDGSK